MKHQEHRTSILDVVMSACLLLIYERDFKSASYQLLTFALSSTAATPVSLNMHVPAAISVFARSSRPTSGLQDSSNMMGEDGIKKKNGEASGGQSGPGQLSK